MHLLMQSGEFALSVCNHQIPIERNKLGLIPRILTLNDFVIFTKTLA